MMVPKRIQETGPKARELRSPRRQPRTEEYAGLLDEKIYQTRNEWFAAALRSGDYDHGIVLLATEMDEFCALGVATEIAMENGCAVSRRKHPEKEYYLYRDHSRGEEVYGTLLKTVAEWYGWGLSKNADLAHTVEFNGRGYRTLAEMSDDMVPFWFIADAVEERLIK